MPPVLRPKLEIVIAGETNLDLILYGLPEELPTDRELLGTSFTTTLGGSSSILAHNLALLGTKVGFISDIGEDPLGRIALDFLESTGADLSHLRRIPGATTGVTLLLPHGKRRHILTYPGVMSQLSVADLDPAYVRSAPHFHLSSLFLQTGLHDGLPGFLDALKRDGLTLSLDTNDDPSGEWAGVLDEVLNRVDLLLPNEDELLQIARASSVEQALDTLSTRIPLIVVKCGSRGAVVQRGSRRDWVSPLTVTPVDTIGAGDSFNAGFLSRWLRGADPLEAAAMGNVTGALSTLRPGGVAAHRDDALRQQFFAANGAAPANES